MVAGLKAKEGMLLTATIVQLGGIFAWLTRKYNNVSPNSSIVPEVVDVLTVCP